MTALLYQLPTEAPAQVPVSLNLSATEVVEASGGYKRPAEQLEELHRRGFVRAWRRRSSGKVVLERAHYDSVVRGQFGSVASPETAARPPAQPNRAGFSATFGSKKATA